MGAARKARKVGPRETGDNHVAKGRGTAQAVPVGSVLESAKGPAFPIVALGASAGGLEAMEGFFMHMPPESGLAFVVVAHQHPGHTSLLPELIGKWTRMPIFEATEGMRIRQNCIYLSRPGEFMAIRHGCLHLVALAKQGGVRLPIDHVFRSLAEDLAGGAIGIVLSGTGSDGTLGIKAIKGAMGLVIAQDPESAKYTGMPASAIETGLVDFVLSPDQMPPQLIAYAWGRFLPLMRRDPAGESALPESMRTMLAMLRSQGGHDFSAYKPNTIRRRIERRMNLHQVKNTEHYVRYLRENPHELSLLFRELLIGVTSFFRDAAAFEVLAGKLLPELLRARAGEDRLRIWVPACSTGEEAYSIAILLVECMERLKLEYAVQIFGTDLDSEAVDKARAGLYPEGIQGDVSAQRLERFFVREDSVYRISKQIRKMVVFAPQNVVADPPFTKLDLLSCRNLMIYLKAETQKRLLGLFHYSLRPGGVLVLGPSESIGEFGSHFAAKDRKWKIFTRKETLLSPRPLGLFPLERAAGREYLGVDSEADEPRCAPRATVAFEKLMLKRFVPTCVVVNERGDISYLHGKTGDYLEPAPGHPRMNLLEMAREGLRHELSMVFRRAVLQESEIVQECIHLRANGEEIDVSLSVQRITEPESLRGLFLVVFRTEPTAPGSPRLAQKRRSRTSRSRELELERELLFTRESLQGTVEELETSNEELKSSNEELQSLNEELQTVNAQLQGKLEALAEANDDMQNLLNSTSIGTIFLSCDLKIKRFTQQALSVINLIPTDVGRPVGDLASNLNYPQMVEDAGEVLRTLVFKEREVQTRDGGWRLVRIHPYRTTENVIDGLVITFIDVNRLKQAELAAEQAHCLELDIVATVREPMLVLDDRLRVLRVGRSFCEYFGLNPDSVEGRSVYELNDGQWDVPELRVLLDDVLTRNSSFEDFEVTLQVPPLGGRRMLLNARRLEAGGGRGVAILLAMDESSGSGRTRRVGGAEPTP